MQVMLDRMIALCVNKFQGKFDKGGKPYILHCLKVMHYVDSEDDELNCIAVGHDLVEDTDITFAEFKELYYFSDRIIDGIRALTKQQGESYDEYLTRVKGNHDACLVKLADLRHNSDLRRLKGITEKDIKRLEKYAKAYRDIQFHIHKGTTCK